MKKTNRIKITFKISAILCTAVLLIHIISMCTFDVITEYKEASFYSKNIPLEMDGYKIAFISDLHSLDSKSLEKIVSKLNIMQLDLLILGGDYHPNNEDMQHSMKLLSEVATADGIYGIEGNHDNYANVFATMEYYSIQPLSNNGVHIRENFYLAGVEDLWNRNPNIEKAIEESQPDDFIIIAAHNPDLTMKQNTKSIDLILSGHTHGGHITFFGIWAPALKHLRITDYGQRFMSGWAKSRDETPVYVSNGAGLYEKSAPRIFARPQIIIITLYDD